MDYIIKMMNGDSYKISKETFNKLEGKTGLIHFKEIDSILNLNSVVSISSIKLSSSLSTRKKNKDGQWCIDKFKQNDWRLENNPDIKADLNYYPELRNDYNQETSNLEDIKLIN